MQRTTKTPPGHSASRLPFPAGVLAGAAVAVVFVGCSLLVDTSDLAGGGTHPPDASAGDAGSLTRGGPLPPSTSPDGAPEASPGSGGSAYAAAVLADQPLVYLRLGESGSAIDAADTSGKGSDGAYLGNVTQGIPGALVSDPNTAVRFDGSDSALVRLAASFDFANTAPFSLELWVRPEGTIDGDSNGLVGRSSWGLFMQSGQLKFQRQTDNGVNWEGPWYTTALLADRFTHVVGTFDGTTMHLYLDGLDVGQAGASLVLPTASDAVQVGNHFPGSIDEVAIYDHALVADRVRAHHEIGAGTVTTAGALPP